MRKNGPDSMKDVLHANDDNLSPVGFRSIDGVRIRYADSGGSPEPTVLLTSPWPESVYAFAPMWALAFRARPPLRR